jgi:hypothetical protein
VAITAPTGSATPTFGAPTTITANATPSSGASITQVEFFVNGASVAIDTALPYSVVWTPSTVGTNTLTAVATQSGAATTTSSAVVLTVNGLAPTISLSAPLGGTSVVANTETTVVAVPTASSGASITQVAFFAGATQIGVATAPPYSIAWTPTVAGAASLTARVTDSTGTTATSSPVNITVTAAVPTVALTSPTVATTLAQGVPVTLTASASSAGATVTRVDFLVQLPGAGSSTVVGSLLAPPYAFTWTPTTAGIVAISARATDSTGATATSAAVNVTVAAPTVTLTTPANASSVGLGAPLTLTATTTAGSVSRMEFLAQLPGSSTNTVVGTVLTPPYTFSWTPSNAGVVVLTAKVTDSNNIPTTSAPVNITVVAPSVALTAPANTATVPLGAVVPLTATASAVGSAAIARVEFLAGTTVVGLATTAPYTANWTPTAAGPVVLTARVTDSNNATATSTAVNVSVAAPAVALTSPLAGATANVGIPITLTASAAAVGGGTLTSVEFFAGTTLIGSATVAPYTVSWTPSTAATVALTAKAYDSNGSSATSTPVSITVTAVPPTVSLTSPTAAATVGLSAPVTLTASASATGGTVMRVDFLAQLPGASTSTVVGSLLTPPYSFTWTPTAAGIVGLSARVTDSNGTVATSPAISVIVVAPIVVLTSPAAASVATVGVAVPMTATASTTAPATIARVEFLASGTLVGTATTAPYSFSWIPTAAGSVPLSARVIDSNGATTTSSPPVNVAVTASPTPTIAITNPVAGASVVLGSSTSISATAAPSAAIAGVTVTRVDFLADGVLIGSDSTAPYSVAWTPSATGTVVLTAQVTDSGNNTATATLSVPVVVANAPTVALTIGGGSAVIPIGSARVFGVDINAGVTTGFVAIDRVEFYYDGSLIATDVAAPYNYAFVAPNQPGAHQVYARVIDILGQTTNSAVFGINITPPVGSLPNVAISYPVNGAYGPTGNVIAITGTVADSDGTISSVQVFANGVLVGNASVSGGAWSINWNPQTIGAISLTAIATDDKANAVVAPASIFNVTDTTSPTLTLSVSPGGATLPAGATRNILATATPSVGRALARVEFFVNGGKVGEKTSAPYSYRYTAPTIPGTYIFSARATDNAGSARDAQVSLTVAAAVGTAPTAVLITPASNITVIPNTAISLAASAISPTGTVSSVQFYVNGSPVGNPIANPPYTGSYTPTATGTYVFDAIATDDRGNTGVSRAATVTAAFGTPTIAITSPRVDINNPSAVVRVTPLVPLTIATTAAGGSGATVLTVEFLVDGVQIGTRTTGISTGLGGALYSFPWTPDLTMLGAHVLTTKVTDTNSQSATSAPVNINVATVVGTPPTITVTAPTNNSTIQSFSTINLIANSFATGGTVSSVEFFVNDASVGLAVREQATNVYRLAYDLQRFDFSALTATLDGNGNPRYPLTFYAISKDSSGNQTVTLTFTMNVVPAQSRPPSVQLVTLGTPSVTAGTPFAIAAITSDTDGFVSLLQVFSNGTIVSQQGSPAQNALIQFTPQTAGRFNLYAVATDETGNTAVSSPVVLNVTGNVAPTCELVRPANDATVTTINTPVFLEATASDPDLAQSVSVAFINAASGATVANGQRVGTTNTYRAIWTPTQANTYTVAARAADTAGATTTSSAARRVVVNNVIGIAPTVSISVPGTATTATTANFTATSSDSDGSVIDVEFFLNRNSIGSATRDQLTNTWRLTAVFAGLTPGNTEVVARARDSSGNVAASSTSNINVTAASSIAPSITITPSTTDAPFNRQLQLTANARDADGTITSVQYFSNATSLGSTGNSGTNYRVTWTPSQSGTFNVWAVATDNTGNSTVAPTVLVTVRRNNPVLEDAAFILQTYQDIANTTSINPLDFADLDARLGDDTLTRADLVDSLIKDPGFLPPVNLLASYYVIMGQWPTPQNYITLLATARGGLSNAINSIIFSNEYLAKYPEKVTPTVALLNNPLSVIPAKTFEARLWANAGLGAPSDIDDVRFRSNNNTFNGTLGRGYNPVGLPTAIAEFITNTNATNTALFNRARAAALYYQLNRPPTPTSLTATQITDQIAVRVEELARLPDTKSMADAALKDILYAYRYVTITKHPDSLTVAPRSGVLFGVEAIGAPPLAYQWLLNGAPIPGGTSSILSLTNVDTSRVGAYTVVVTSSAAAATSDPATLLLSSTPTRLGNISTRGVTSGGANVLIGGFVVSGAANQTRQMLIRVVGPSLAAAGVTGFLANPRLEVYAGANRTPVLVNDDWENQTGGAAAVTAIRQAANRGGAFNLPASSADAAVLATLPAGAYTVMAKGPNDTASGVVLIEVYDVTQGAAAGPKAANVSTRGVVGTGGNILIAGFVVNGAVSRRLLIRGAGPTLQAFGLPANTVLADPQITLVDQATGKTIKSNDDWASGEDAAVIAAAATAAGSFPFANGSKDAAMIVMLTPGAYTVQLRGVGNATGIGIVEVYDVDP